MRHFMVVTSLLIAASLAIAVEVKMTPDEQEQCEAQGGCEFVSMRWLRQALLDAYEKGLARGIKSCVSGLT